MLASCSLRPRAYCAAPHCGVDNAERVDHRRNVPAAKNQIHFIFVQAGVSAISDAAEA
jgi:hypothetical protein